MLDDGVRFFLRIDGKFLKTLRGLVRPGFLTTEYFAGRRERYEKPFRLFVVLTALSLLLIDQRQLTQFAMPAAPDDKAAAAIERVLTVLMGHMQALSFVIYLLLAATLRLVYRKQDVRFAEHFVFSLHLGAQLALFGVFLTPLQWLNQNAWLWASQLMVMVVGVMAAHRVYGESWWRATLRFTLAFSMAMGGYVLLGGLVGVVYAIATM